MKSDVVVHARVIHELDEQGNVLRTGWEPGGSVEERAKAFRQLVNLLSKGGEFAAVLDEPTRRHVAYARWIEAVTDMRCYMPALQRDYQTGAGLPRWLTSPVSNRYQGYRRSA